MSTSDPMAGALTRASRLLESEGVDRLLDDVAKFNGEHQMPTGQETRVVSATGGEKGSKLARYDLIPQDAQWVLAEHYGRGARKYADRNWEKGYAWSLSYAAMLRHFASFWMGEDIDPDPSLLDDDQVPRSLHVVAGLWHANALTAFVLRGIGEDDRPKR